MKLIKTYNQSFSSAVTTGAELTFSWKHIFKTKPHHKFLIRPSLVIANHLGTDITANNNTFIFQVGAGAITTYTIPNGNYTGAQMATQLTALTQPVTGTTWGFLGGDKLQMSGAPITRIFYPSNNSALGIMGYVTGKNYSQTTPVADYAMNFTTPGYLYLNYTPATSKTGNETEIRQQNGTTLSRIIQGKYQIASLPLNQAHLAEEDVCNNEGLLLDEMPLTPFTITMETENGVQMTSTNRIEYSILFTIMEVDTNDEPKLITNRIVANHIRCIAYMNQANTNHQFESVTFFNGLVKQNPKNKWFVVCSLANTSGSGTASTTGRFFQITHTSFTNKCQWNTNTNPYRNRYFIAMPIIVNQSPARMTNVGNGLLIDDFSPTPLTMLIGQGTADAGTALNFASVFNIYEIEYL